MKRTAFVGLTAALLSATSAHAQPVHIDAGLPKVTTDDLIRIVDVDALSVSPDGSRYALAARRSDPDSNTYHVDWYVGSTVGGTPKWATSAGEFRPYLDANGDWGGDVEGPPVRWSPDGKWFAYPLKRNGEVQLWKAASDGRTHQQLTFVAGDVVDFAWSDDGSHILFRTDIDRVQIAREREAQATKGYRYSELTKFTELVFPDQPPRGVQSVQSYVINANGGEATAATDDQVRNLEALLRAEQGTFLYKPGDPDVVENRTQRPDGSVAWFERVGREKQAPIPILNLKTQFGSNSNAITCSNVACRGQFLLKSWWLPGNDDILFWRKIGVSQRQDAFYIWSPRNGKVRLLYTATDDVFKDCTLRRSDLFCLRESTLTPWHVFKINTPTGQSVVIADLNTELSKRRLGRVEHIEYDLPDDVYDLGLPKRARARIVFPPDFNPAKKYPVFIAPYVAQGFVRGDGGDEQPLLPYAANGMIVLNTEFPMDWPGWALENRTAREQLEAEQSMANGFPRYQFLMDSTFAALDLLISRGYADPRRVGIGGISHGSLIPMFMMQHKDRIAAASFGSPGWTSNEPYVITKTGYAQWNKLSGGNIEGWQDYGPAFFAALDLADNVEKLEGPILLQWPDREAILSLPRLSAKLLAADKPFDAFIFKDETHVKWQPAHRQSIYNRNLDWFRFWLQDVEDPDPAKSDQYVSWRKLRELQCRNPRSLRDYCKVVSMPASVSR